MPLRINDEINFLKLPCKKVRSILRGEFEKHSTK